MTKGVPLRTLENVKADLADAAKTQGADEALARVMLRHGRLTNEAREFVTRYLSILDYVRRL
jgi:hypothetical protein